MAKKNLSKSKTRPESKTELGNTPEILHRKLEWILRHGSSTAKRGTAFAIEAVFNKVETRSSMKTMLPRFKRIETQLYDVMWGHAGLADYIQVAINGADRTLLKERTKGGAQ